MDLCRVGGQVDLLGGAALAGGVDDHAVAGQLGAGRPPGDGEGGWTHLRELQVGGGRNGYRRRWWMETERE